MNIPVMTDAERSAFHKAVKELLRAGWNTGKIRDWAIGPASGFARFWTDPTHPLEIINAICRAQNRVIAAQNRIIRKRIIDAARTADPFVDELFRKYGPPRFRR